jgi:hypothetical protein
MPYDHSFPVQVHPALADAFDDTLADVYDGRLYFQVAPPNRPFPCCVYQYATGNSDVADYVGFNGWDATFLFRSMDYTISGAYNNLKALVNKLPEVTVSGWYVSYKVGGTIQLPVERISTGDIHTAGIQINIKVANFNTNEVP